MSESAIGDAPGKVVGIARRARAQAPMESLEVVAVTADSGVDGDHRGQLRNRQVTVLSQESWNAACADLGRQLPWTTRRANILVQGLQLQETIGKTIRIGSLVLEITDETNPCTRMEEQSAGLRAALTAQWRGGVTCRVASGGTIRVGDAAELREAT